MAACDERLASVLGVSPGVVLKIRRTDLNKGVDWTEERDGRIAFTEAGIAAVRERLAAVEKDGGGDDSAPEVPAAPAASEAPAGDLRRLKVVRLMPNPLWVSVEWRGTAVPVRVRRRETLRVGSMIECRVSEGGITCTERRHAV